MDVSTKVWDLRIAEDDDRLVRAAAAASDTEFSSFIRSAALAEAHRVLARGRQG